MYLNLNFDLPQRCNIHEVKGFMKHHVGVEEDMQTSVSGRWRTTYLLISVGADLQPQGKLIYYVHLLFMSEHTCTQAGG